MSLPVAMSLIFVRVIRSVGAFAHEVSRFWEQMFGLLLAVLFSGAGVIAFVLCADGAARRFLAGGRAEWRHLWALI